MDDSGAEVFTVLLPSGTPLPARRHHILSGGGKLSSLCLEIYQRFVTEQPEKLAKVQKSTRTTSDVEEHALPDFVRLPPSSLLVFLSSHVNSGTIQNNKYRVQCCTG